MPQKNIDDLKFEINRLKEELRIKEEMLHMQLKNENKPQKILYNSVLSTDEIVRYSRQMIVPSIGLQGQLCLKNGKVLIVGVGGLGCPAALYLSSAGIGKIILMDYDDVELSNLHRQVLHSEYNIDFPKVESAYHRLKSINHHTSVVHIQQHANSETVKEIIEKYQVDIVVDGSDNVATRYLLNDVCVMKNIPLVSGSALQMEGQLTVYHYQDGPCYRCLFPVPPPPETVTNCGDGGVLGPVPGTIGTLQALEVIKILTKSQGVLAGRLLLFDGSNTTFRNVKLRGKNPKCAVCGECPTITNLIDYEQFCGSSAHDKVIDIDILKPEEQITVKELLKILDQSFILDVRPELEYQMCSIPGTVNVPFTQIEKGIGIDKLHDLLKNKLLERDRNVYVLCRRGNDSQRAISCLKDELSNVNVKLYNVKGGLHAYSSLIDPSFPKY